MDLEKAIKTALEYETKVCEIYWKDAREAIDEVAKRIFGVLADEESYHVEYLKERLKEWEETGHITAEKLDTAIPSKEEIEQELNKLEQRMSDEDHGQELLMLRKALDMEVETSAFYKKMVNELTDEGRKMFKRFVEIEDGHIAIVQAEIDNLTGVGFWFDFEEFKLETG